MVTINAVEIDIERMYAQTMFPWINLINILCANFTYESFLGSFFYLHVTREKLLKRRSYKIFVRKMLMKLTP